MVAARLPPVPTSGERCDVGVAEDHPDVLEPDAEDVGGHLGQRRLVALTVRLLAGDHDDRSVLVDRHVGHLVAEDARRLVAGPGILGPGAASR